MTSKPTSPGAGTPNTAAQKAADRDWSDAPVTGPARGTQRGVTSAPASPARAAQAAGSGKGLGQMGIGLAMFVIGIVITVGSYSAASSGSGGGTYVVTWGLIVFGFIRMVTGFFTWISNR